jgi:3-methyladenine DNA glycosylase/8-oxoguanine DNA glycosylase
MMPIYVSVPADFSFQETITAHGWRHLAPFVWHEQAQTLEKVEELTSGNVVRLRIHGCDDRLCIDVEEEGDEADIVQRVRRMLQLDLPLSDFHAYCAASPKLAPIAACRQGRMLRSSTLYEDAVKVIATTNTTWSQTMAMTARLSEHFGAQAPHDPAKKAFPTPQRIAAASFEEFAAKARMGYRSAYVYDLAGRIARGELDLEAWQDPEIPALDLRKKLLSLPGIGPYGAACLMLYLGKPEHVNADSWARTLVSKELGHPATDKDVHAFFESHGPWRGLVYNFYPWRHP